MYFCIISNGAPPVVIRQNDLLQNISSQSFLRMVATRQGIAIAARKGGKIKTVFYIISGFAFLAVESAIRLGILDFSAYYSIVKYVLTGFFAVCLLLSYISFIDYLKNFSSVFKNA